MFCSTSGVITRNHKTPELPQFKPVTWKKKISHFTFLSEFSLKIENVMLMLINPSIPISDQDRISPYNIETISSPHMMRIKEDTNSGIIS